MTTILHRVIRFRFPNANEKAVGTLKQVYAAATSDFYFFPALKQLSDRGKTVDHFSFHFSGQSHLKFTDAPKHMIIDKQSNLAQPGVGCYPFLALRFDPSILPTCSACSAEGDVVLDAPDGTSLWLELTFVSSDFLLGNDLGFGTPLTNPELTASYLGRKVLAVGHLPTTDHMMLQFAFGRASNLHRPTHLETKTFKTQMPHAHRIHEASNANGKA